MALLKTKDYLTLGNAASGFLAVVLAFPYGYFASAALILLAVVFDVLDGMIARKTKSHDEFGKQLDSLADAVSFAAAPAVVISLYYGLDLLVVLASLFFVFCGILRLAKFNIQKQNGFYYGLPSPLAALVVMAFAWLNYYAALFLLFLAGFLMLSRFKNRKPF
jgi:CDP-diacylglycerol--serine O-phosphatidyltransferase